MIKVISSNASHSMLSRMVSTTAGTMVMYANVAERSQLSPAGQGSCGDWSRFNTAERRFLQCVLELQGAGREPTPIERERATDVMRSYVDALSSNESRIEGRTGVKRWMSTLSWADRTRVMAAAYLRFGAVRPNIFQLRTAYASLAKSSYASGSECISA